MKERLLVTGYGGFVAGSVVWQAHPAWDVYAFSLTESRDASAGFRCFGFDLRDTTELRRAFDEVKPAAVVHTAAMADIDYCESHQAEAEAVNVGVTTELARLCRDAGAKLVFCSTDSLFDGAGGMYREDDPPGPINFYAETKVRAEQTVQECLDNAVVARLSLVLGLPVLGVGNSFLAKMIRQLEAGDSLPFPANEVRTPVDVITVGRALLELAGNDFIGTIHLAGTTRLNRYDMACCIADRLGFSREQILATDSNAVPRPAPRPNDVSLDNTKARRVLETPMRSLTDGLELVLECKEKQKHG